MEGPTLTHATVAKWMCGPGGTEDDADEDTYEWCGGDSRLLMRYEKGRLDRNEGIGVKYYGVNPK